MTKSKLLAICFLVAAALGCSENSDSGDDPSGASDDREEDERDDEANDADDEGDEPEDGELSVASTYLEVASVAKLIYDAVQADEDVSPYIEAVLAAFGVPTLEPDDEEGALARIEEGLPFVTTRVVEQMAAAYSQSILIGAEGFTAGLSEQGVEAAYPFNLEGTELDHSLLGGMIYSYAIVGESTPDVPLEAGYVLPSLVRELGQERARRLVDMDPEDVDPAWGDGRLDPLQFTLLSFTIFAKPGSPELTSFGSAGAAKGLLQASVGINFIKDQLKDKAEGELTSAVQQLVEVPLDKQDAAKVSVCGSLILYGHKVAITNTPNLLWHAPNTPNLTEVEMTLTFEDDYHNNWARAVLGSVVTDLTGCTFPRQGPIEGKAVVWDVSSGLEGHGSYDIMGTVTNDEGKALASWRTVRDEFPEACEVFEKQRDAVGATEAVVSGLLSGWSTVEAIVTFLNPNTGTQGDAPLTVLYYDVTTDDPCHNE